MRLRDLQAKERLQGVPASVMWSWLASRHRTGEKAFAVRRTPGVDPKGEPDASCSEIWGGLLEGDRFWRAAQRQGSAQKSDGDRGGVAGEFNAKGTEETAGDNATRAQGAEGTSGAARAGATDKAPGEYADLGDQRRTRRSPSDSDEDGGNDKIDKGEL